MYESYACPPHWTGPRAWKVERCTAIEGMESDSCGGWDFSSAPLGGSAEISLRIPILWTASTKRNGVQASGAELFEKPSLQTPNGAKEPGVGHPRAAEVAKHRLSTRETGSGRTRPPRR